ncbi:MAG: hypothetical protein PUA81_02705 [Oscillospiraceae bacterium]|nr:hypothetical protein [Oscillospiraceae bacterium]
MLILIAVLAVLCFANAVLCCKAIKKYSGGILLTIKPENEKMAPLAEWETPDGTKITVTKRMNKLISKNGEVKILVIDEKPGENCIPQAVPESDAPGKSEVIFSIALGLIFTAVLIAYIL